MRPILLMKVSSHGLGGLGRYANNVTPILGERWGQENRLLAKHTNIYNTIYKTKKFLDGQNSRMIFWRHILKVKLLIKLSKGSKSFLKKIVS